MVEMNKQKQEEIKGFLLWLEDYIGAEVEVLTNKTKIRARYVLDVLAILKKNKRERWPIVVDADCHLPSSRDLCQESLNLVLAHLLHARITPKNASGSATK